MNALGLHITTTPRPRDLALARLRPGRVHCMPRFRPPLGEMEKGWMESNKPIDRIESLLAQTRSGIDLWCGPVSRPRLLHDETLVRAPLAHHDDNAVTEESPVIVSRMVRLAGHPCS